MIFWGPPGTGKTTIAMALAGEAAASFEQLSAVGAGVKELREVVERARHRIDLGDRTLLFIDEIHRWNKSQQDQLLPHIEAGTIILVGATTENPGVEINRALLSRVTVYELRSLDDTALINIATRTLEDSERGLGRISGDTRPPLTLPASLHAQLLLQSGGDARTLINILEQSTTLQPGGGAISEATLHESMGRRNYSYDRAGDQHYDTVSAFIKSIRGSDKNAALYYMARMAKGGEDPKFIARRLVISAGEEIGIADPHALVIAIAGFHTVEKIGHPECWINLAAVVNYLCDAPKSWDSYFAWRRALDVVEETPSYPIPRALRNAPNDFAGQQGNGKDYQHPGMSPDTKLQYLPDELRDLRLFDK
jgi:putative ATPase